MSTLKILVSTALVAITFSIPQAIHGMERASRNEGQKNPPGMPFQNQEIEELEKRLHDLRGVHAAAQKGIPPSYEQPFEPMQAELTRKLKQEAAEARIAEETEKLRIREAYALLLHIAILPQGDETGSSDEVHIQLPPLHVLVAEDNRVNQKIVRSMLKRLGCSVVVVENGQEALEAVQRGRYDIVLMDGEMPEMDGLEATRRIRDIFNKNILPILGITSQTLPQDRERFLESGMNEYLTKPLKQQDLETAIWGCLESCGRTPKSVNSD